MNFFVVPQCLSLAKKLRCLKQKSTKTMPQLLPQRLRPSTTRGWTWDVLVSGTALLLLTASMLLLHGLTSGLSGSDEGSHFLNGYLIWTYLSEGVGQNPLAYATDFYVHYPKISIGHWPPLYYVFLSAFFFVLPHVPLSLMLVNLIVGALPVWLISRAVRPVLGRPWAMLAGITFIMMPLCLNNTVRLMLEQAIAGLCLLGMLMWSRYAERPSLVRALTYACVTAVAILVKGNGWLLAIYPVFHVALTSRWKLMLNWRTYAAGAAGLLVVSAWSILTYKISSDGFNFAWGWSYVLTSAPIFVTALYNNVGPLGLLALFLGATAGRRVSEHAAIRELASSCVALVLATLIFHFTVPVDTDPRYMSPATPALAILMAMGVWVLWHGYRRFPVAGRTAAAVAALLFAIPGLLFLAARPPRYDLRMDVAATELLASQSASVIVVDGDAGAEGALTAEVALRDRRRQNYVIRSSQLLAKSDFMGRRYALRFDTPASVLRALDEASCTALVIADGPAIGPRFEHSKLLLVALNSPDSPYKRVQAYEHKRHAGHTTVYLRDPGLLPQPAAVKRVNFPEKAAAL